jgi:hypothetical protein
MISNPFTNRGVITNPDDFIGRRQQLSEITTRLRTMQSCSVVGERRIGKSSLLYHLSQTGTQRVGDASYRFVYLDFQDIRLSTTADFLRTILNRLGASADGIKDDHKLNRNLIAFSEVIEAMEQAGQRIVLCLDEFEGAFKHPQEFNDDFFDHLRSMLNHRRLAFVTATQQTLQNLCLDGKLVSPFYNLFTVTELKEFTEEEAEQFVAVYHQKAAFTEDELKLISSYLSLHPLKLQILCDLIIQNRERQLADWALEKEIVIQYSNFFVGSYDLKNIRRAKKFLSLDYLGKMLERLKSARDLLTGKE